MLDYLDDIASDLSAFHRVDDANDLEAAVFFTLAVRLPAYQGVLAARLASEERGGKRPGRAREAASYERGSRYANRASTAASAPPATAGQIAALNMQMGGGWFTHRTVPAGGGD